MAEQTVLLLLAPAAEMVNKKGDIFYLHGRTGTFFEPAAGEATVNNIFKMAREGLRQQLINALHKVVTTQQTFVTDYNMPGLSGLDVATQVREIRPDVPVFVTSGFIDQKLHTHADEAGVRALIPKPFPAKYFCDLLKQILSERAD